MFWLLNLLDGLRLDPTMRDGWEWVITKRGSFTSKSLYLELTNYRSFLFTTKAVGFRVFLLKSFSFYGIPTWIKF